MSEILDMDQIKNISTPTKISSRLPYETMSSIIYPFYFGKSIVVFEIKYTKEDIENQIDCNIHIKYEGTYKDDIKLLRNSIISAIGLMYDGISAYHCLRFIEDDIKKESKNDNKC